MKVYAIHETSESILYGVFLSKQRAEEVAAQLTERSKDWGAFWVEEYEVDQKGPKILISSLSCK